MLSEKELHELLDYQSKHPVLSVYLNTDPSEGNADAYRLRMRTMLKETKQAEDVAAVERFFAHEYDWTGRSVAVFSCQAEGFFRAYPLAVAVRSRVRVSDHPHVKPLADLLDAYGGYGVVLIDKQGARVFHFHLGALVEQEGVLGETVRHTKHGGASAVPGRRGGTAGQTNADQAVIERNMKEAADFAAHFFAEKNARRILIGGTDDNVALFRGHLPKSWQSLVIGTFPMSMTASKDEVLARAMQVGREVEQRRAAHLVETMITNAAKGRGGVLGLDESLRAVHEGRVQTLVIQEGLRLPGYRCTGCGYLTAKAPKKCPFCGQSFDQIPDAVELAVYQIMQRGGEVEVLHADEIKQDFGGIGAILRY